MRVPLSKEWLAPVRSVEEVEMVYRRFAADPWLIAIVASIVLLLVEVASPFQSYLISLDNANVNTIELAVIALPFLGIIIYPIIKILIERKNANWKALLFGRFQWQASIAIGLIAFILIFSSQVLVMDLVFHQMPSLSVHNPVDQLRRTGGDIFEFTVYAPWMETVCMQMVVQTLLLRFGAIISIFFTTFFSLLCICIALSLFRRRMISAT